MRMGVKNLIAKSLSHTRYNCKYHIIFIPKYRRKVIYNKLRNDIQKYIVDLCKWKEIEIIEGHLMPDHVHLLVEIPLRISISNFMRYPKEKSCLMIFEYHANLKRANSPVKHFGQLATM